MYLVYFTKTKKKSLSQILKAKIGNCHAATNMTELVRDTVILILKHLIADSQIYITLLTGFPLPERFGRYQRNEQKQNQRYNCPHFVDV